jgi:adapter protein MecA 1/2
LKIEKLNENKIKFTITIDDLTARNIDLYSFVYNSPESQDLFWDMMNEAEREYGFNVDDSMIYVETATAGSESFTLTVTKTNEKPQLKVNKEKVLAPRDNVKLKRKKMPYFIKNGIFKFDTFDDVCSFCKVANVKAIIDTKLYSYNDSYYLKAGIMPTTSILEYAQISKNPDMLGAKLDEYGKMIIDCNVIEIISKHFNKTTKKPRAK